MHFQQIFLFLVPGVGKREEGGEGENRAPCVWSLIPRNPAWPLWPMHLLTRETVYVPSPCPGTSPALGGGWGAQDTALHSGFEAARAPGPAEERPRGGAHRVGARRAGRPGSEAGPGDLQPLAGAGASCRTGARRNLAHFRLAPGRASASAAWAGRHAWQGR